MSAKKNNKKQQEEMDKTFDLADDFKCAELLLDADQDRKAFELFLAIATSKVEIKERKQDAIDKLIYILLKNSHSFNLLDDETWGIIEKLTEKGKGYEYAYLMMHFKYYVNGKSEEEDKNAYDYLVKYFDSCKKNKSGVSPVAYLQMGICKEWGIGGGIDDISVEEALENYQKALAGGCVDAYKHIVGVYLYGNKEFPKNVERAKEVLEEGLKCFKEKHKRKDKEIYPFFANLVNYCFKDWGKYSKNMNKRGKELAQYMIDGGIKGGRYIMGQYFLFDFNMTMAKTYYEQAINSNEVQAYDTLADFYFYADNYEESYKLACRGKAVGNDNCLRSLGQLYEKQGDDFLSTNKEKAKICYQKAWECYLELYYRTGAFHNCLGKLYLDREVQNRIELKDLEIILEKGAFQLFPESIKFYLRLIQYKHGIDNTGLHSEEADKLPADYKKKYFDYLKAGAEANKDTGDYDLRIEYFLKHGEEEEKKKLFKELFDGLYIPSSEKQFVDILEYYDGCEKDDSFMVWFIKAFSMMRFEEISEIPVNYRAYINIKSEEKRLLIDIDAILRKVGAETQDKILKMICEDIPLSVFHIKSVFKYSDNKKFKNKLFNETFKYHYLLSEYIDYAFEYEDERRKSWISRKLILDSYSPQNTKQFANIIENYKGKKFDSIMPWFTRSIIKLFYQERDKLCKKLAKELKKAIKKSKDENLKCSWEALKNVEYDPAFLDEVIRLGMTASQSLNVDVSDGRIQGFLFALGKTDDEDVKKIFERFGDELDKFVYSLD